MVPENVLLKSVGVCPCFFLKMRLKLDMLLNPQSKHISEIVLLVSISSLVAKPRRISFRKSMKHLPVRCLIRRVKEMGDILSSLAASSSLIFLL